MDFNRIDVLEQGTVWQGGSPDASIDQAPFAGPLLIVCMDTGELNESLIDHKTVEAVLAVWIQDESTGEGPLPDAILKAHAQAVATYLGLGFNVYIHCAAGVSRASYMDVAVHCTVLGISANEALARIRAQRPVVNPNPGFLAQLQRLWP